MNLFSFNNNLTIYIEAIFDIIILHNTKSIYLTYITIINTLLIPLINYIRLVKKFNSFFENSDFIFLSGLYTLNPISFTIISLIFNQSNYN